MQPPAELTEKTTIETSIDWDDLYFDLKNGRAVLILGPEFYTKEEISPKQSLYNELTAKEDHGILHFYPGNGIFLFKSEYYKTKAQKLSSKFYKTLEADQNIVQKIIELPFSLIINTNPDRILDKAYKVKGIECQFDYFTFKPQKKDKEISKPDNYYPLIYNLFGSVDFHESIVLDFEDLFDHLRSLLNNVNVPEVVRNILLLTDTYIFIGFRLEKWDTQLLFRYLNMKDHGFDDSKKNYTTKSLNIDDSFESFFRQQFNLKYYGVPIEFLNEMYHQYFAMYAKEDSEQMDQLSPRKRIEYYIANDEIEKSLNYITKYFNDQKKDLPSEIILLKSRFVHNMNLKNRKLESPEVLEIERNKIKQSILDTTADFK